MRERATVVAVSAKAKHGFTKFVREEITLLAGLGVEGDAHCGATVQHRYLKRRDSSAPNLCQIHLLHEELFETLAKQGLDITPGQMGENITTRGLNLLSLGRGAHLHLGASAIVRITGLREPCSQMNGLRPGLMKACLRRDPDGKLIRLAGVMGIVMVGGVVRPGDAIEVRGDAGAGAPLTPV